MTFQDPTIIRGDILTVDDKPDNLRVLSKALAEQGHEVRAVLDGEMALSVVQTDPPDLILLDIRMPGMVGFEVCEKLKADQKTCHIPVIFLSALNDPTEKVKAFKAGGVDYITKPFQPEEVLARVNSQLTIDHLRRELVAQNQNLKRSNQELEEFSYSVSHDLKQPLHSILGLTKVLNIQYQKELDEKGLTLLAHLENAARFMNELIDKLLDYSQLSNRQAVFKPIDCNSVLAQVLINLQAAINRSNATITVGSLPTVMGDTVQLCELFQNLLSNAIKFRHPNVAPQITVLAKQEQDHWHFFIRDNGIGIDRDQFEHIFKVFQRGDTQQNYPGTGIGLATCQKVVDQLGGQIWVESTLGVGTTFHFTLPICNTD